MKPISSLQPAESHFAQAVTRQIKGLQTKKTREIFKDPFSEGSWERKVGELKREIMLSRLKVFCGEAGKEKVLGSLKILKFPVWRVNRHAQLVAYGKSLFIAL